MVLLLIGAGWIPFASAPLTFYGMRENPLKMGQTVAGLEVAFPIDCLEYGVGTASFTRWGWWTRKSMC
ncbi:MAG: hypothetical protein ACLFQR_13490 [Desulfovibrionales bacterium]